MESTVKQRLMFFINYLGLSKNAFERECGLSTRAVSNISKSISDDTLKKIILRYPNLNPSWLMIGELPMLRNESNTQQQEIRESTHQCCEVYNEDYTIVCNRDCANCHQRATCPSCGAVIPIKAYTVVPKEVAYSGGVIIREWLQQNASKAKRIDFYRILDPERVVVQKMHDRSMEPRIAENAFIMYSLLTAWEECLRDGYRFDGTIYGVDVAQPHLIFRRVFDEGNAIRCVPVNPDYGSITIDKDKVTGIYEVWAVLDLFKKNI